MVLADMEITGIKVDVDYLSDVEKELKKTKRLFICLLLFFVLFVSAVVFFLTLRSCTGFF